jgi:hypothetical protein
VNKCEECNHVRVCGLRTAKEEVEINILAVPLQEQFVITLTCREFDQMQPTARDMFQMQTQQSYTSGRS